MAKSIIKVFPVEECLSLVDLNKERDALLSNPDVCALENMLKEDYDPNMRIERKNQLVWRDLQIVHRLKEKYNCRCQICGYSFQKNNGDYYCEAHHIVPVSENGSQSPDNVIILCANHHRMFHYASESIVVGSLIDGVREITIGDQNYHVSFA